MYASTVSNFEIACHDFQKLTTYVVSKTVIYYYYYYYETVSSRVVVALNITPARCGVDGVGGVSKLFWFVVGVPIVCNELLNVFTREANICIYCSGCIGFTGAVKAYMTPS